MKNSSRPILCALSLLGALTLTWTAPAAAHHSFAMFDFSKTMTVKGTVTEFRWTNPHVALLVQFDAKPGAAPEVWSMELTSPGNLTRGGWTRHSFKPGDRITVFAWRARDGTNWAQVGTPVVFGLTGSPLAGLAVCSHTVTSTDPHDVGLEELNLSTFDHVGLA